MKPIEPVVTKPIDVKAPDAKPIAMKPIDVKPPDIKPITTKPIDPLDAKSIAKSTFEIKPPVAKPLDIKPFDQEGTQTLGGKPPVVGERLADLPDPEVVTPPPAPEEKETAFDQESLSSFHVKIRKPKLKG